MCYVFLTVLLSIIDRGDSHEHGNTRSTLRAFMHSVGALDLGFPLGLCIGGGSCVRERIEVCKR